MRAHQPVPLKIYFAVFAALLVFTGVTVWVAFFNLGVLNIVVAITIAVLKATLVALFFMHLRSSTRLTQMWAGAAVLWLLILLSLTASDFLSRSW